MSSSSTLTTNELYDLTYRLEEEFHSNLNKILSSLNQSGQLIKILSMMGLEKLLPQDKVFHNTKKKIVVIGQSNTKVDKLIGVAKELGFHKEQFLFCLDYNDAKTFQYNKLQYSSKYAVILVGAIPHSTKDKGNFNSIISALEQQNGYPPVIRIGNNELKITKSSFKQSLSDLISKKLL